MLLRLVGQKYPSSRYEKGIKNGLGQPYCLATRYTFRASLDQSGTKTQDAKRRRWLGTGRPVVPTGPRVVMQKTAEWLWGGEENGWNTGFCQTFLWIHTGRRTFWSLQLLFWIEEKKRRARNPHTAEVERRGGRESDIRLKVLDLFELCRNCCFETAETQLLELHFNKPRAQIFSGVAWNVDLSIDKRKMFIEVDFKSKVFLACEQTLRGALEEEGELTTTSLEVEYRHRKSRCKVLIGRDDNNDVITLATCFSKFVYIGARFCFALIGGNLTAQSTGSHRGIGGGIQIPET